MLKDINCQYQYNQNRNNILFICAIISTIIFTTSTCFAQSKKKLNTFSARSLQSSDTDFFQFRLSESLDDFINTSADTNLYDPLTVMRLRMLKEQAQPGTNIDDIDPEETRNVVQKAFAIQTTTSMMNLIEGSELRDSFRSIERGFKEFTSLFKYSIQDTGDSYSISKKSEGKKLLELNMNFSLSKGADPQFHIGECFRFRYDWQESQTMFEYGINF